MVPTRTISGASACQSNVGRGRTSGVSGEHGGEHDQPPGREGREAVHDGLVGDVEDEVREDAEHDDEHEHRHPGDVLGEVHVVDVLVLELLGGRAERDPLEQPEEVAGGEHGADGGDDHVDPEQRRR